MSLDSPSTSPLSDSPALADAPIELRNQTYDDLTELMQKLGEKRYRGEQLFRWVHARGVTDLDQMTDVSRKLRERLRAENLVRVAELSIDKVQLSVDGTRKLRLKTADDRLIESVLIPDDDARDVMSGMASSEKGPDAYDDDEDEPSWERKKLTQCVSSQVGCTLTCSFCHTGTQRLMVAVLHQRHV